MLDTIDKAFTWIVALFSAVIGATVSWVTQKNELKLIHARLDQLTIRANPVIDGFIILREQVRIQNGLNQRDRHEIIDNLKTLNEKFDAIRDDLVNYGIERRHMERRNS